MLPPTVFQFQWPSDISQDLVSFNNPKGKINNSNLKMAGLLLLWLCIESIVPDIAHKHIALFSNNSPTFSWVDRMALQKSCIAAQLVCALALRLNIKETCPLTPIHIPWCGKCPHGHTVKLVWQRDGIGMQNQQQFTNPFQSKFSLPNQVSWTVFQFDIGMTTRVISALRMKGITLAEWQQLPRIGKHIGKTGPDMSDLWGMTLSYRGCGTRQECVSSQGLQQEYAEASTGKGSKSKLERSLALSRPLDRRLCWPMPKPPKK